MRPILIFLFLCLSGMPGFAQDQPREKEPQAGYLFTSQSDVVRGFIWDLPKDTITGNEKATLIEETQNALFYLDYIDFRRHLIAYGFDEEGKLARIRVSEETQRPNLQEWIERMLVWQARLTERYGDPYSEDFIWHDPLERNMPKYWGNAVARQELDIRVQWRTPHGPVRMLLTAPELMSPELSITFTRQAQTRENLFSVL